MPSQAGWLYQCKEKRQSELVQQLLDEIISKWLQVKDFLQQQPVHFYTVLHHHNVAGGREEKTQRGPSPPPQLKIHQKKKVSYSDCGNRQNEEVMYVRKAAVMSKALLLVPSSRVLCPLLRQCLKTENQMFWGNAQLLFNWTIRKCFFIFLQSTDYTKRPDAGTFNPFSLDIYVFYISTLKGLKVSASGLLL